MLSARLRWFLTAALASLSLGACAPTVEEESENSGDAVTDVKPTPVKEQVIGNCWLYSIVGWAESLHKSATGEELDLSESYLTYWYWYEQLANAGPCGLSSIVEGGSWSLARELVSRYGMMREADFVPEDAGSDVSVRQAQARDDLNAALASKTSPMSLAVAKGDRVAIRRELSKIWKLSFTVQSQLDRVFGEDASQTFDTGARPPAGSAVLHPTQILAAVPTCLQGRTLADALSGPCAWNEIDAPHIRGPATRGEIRRFERRVQRALHDGLPVLVSWWVDEESVDDRGAFRRRPTETPSQGGGHMSIIVDYEVKDVPGFGTLPVGEVETRREALEAALDETAYISFFRIKNSWGTQLDSPEDRIRRQLGGAAIGFNDLYTSYLYDYFPVELDASLFASTSEEEVSCTAPEEGGGEKVTYLVPALFNVVVPPGYLSY